MKKRMISALLLTAMLLCLLTACTSKDSVITAEKAQQIVLKDLGVSASQVEIHTHVTTVDGATCYSIHVTMGEEEIEYVIDPASGEILSKGEGGH